MLDQEESWCKKIFRFLAYVNQSDWRAKKILSLLDKIQDPEMIKSKIESFTKEFESKNAVRLKKDQEPLPQHDLDSLTKILSISPTHLGLIDAADNWVVETQKDFGRFPNDNEWGRLKAGPLDGAIGMSFALQWRYNFGLLFNGGTHCEE